MLSAKAPQVQKTETKDHAPKPRPQSLGTSINQIGRTSISQTGRTSINQTGRTSISQTGRTSINQTGRTSTVDKQQISGKTSSSLKTSTHLVLNVDKKSTRSTSVRKTEKVCMSVCLSVDLSI